MGRYKGNHYDRHKNNSDLINEIKYYDKIGNYDKALVLAEEFLYVHPFDDYVITYKAMILSKLRRNNEAKELLEDLINSGHIKDDKNRLFVYSRYAKILSYVGEIDEAIYYYEKVINESSELELSTRADLANMYSKIGKLKEGIDVLTIDGFNNEYLNIKRAYIYMMNDDYEEALLELNKKEENVLKIKMRENIDRKHLIQEKNYIIGHTYFRFGNFNKAYPYLKKSLDIKNKIIYYYAAIDIAKIYTYRGNTEETLKICEELLKTADNDKLIRKINLTISKAHLKKQDFETAKALIDKDIFSDKDTKIGMGKIELLKGNFEKAEEYFNVLDEEKDDINGYLDSLYSKALVKYRLKKYNEALDIINILEENDEIFMGVGKLKLEISRLKLIIGIIKGNIPDYDTRLYSNQQIISYDRKKALEHIILHHIKNIKTSKFKNEEQIREIFDNVGELLTDDNIVYNSSFDEYIIKYNSVGSNISDGNINQLQVVTLPGTKNIITMYPYDGSDSLLTLEEPKKKDTPKVKRLSQIEKFNKRYNNGQKI